MAALGSTSLEIRNDNRPEVPLGTTYRRKIEGGDGECRQAWNIGRRMEPVEYIVPVRHEIFSGHHVMLTRIGYAQSYKRRYSVGVNPVASLKALIK